MLTALTYYIWHKVGSSEITGPGVKPFLMLVSFFFSITMDFALLGILLNLTD